MESSEERIQKAMESLESLKSSISVMLQFHQANSSERQFLEVKEQLMVLEHNSRAMCMMTHGRSNRVRGELDGNAFADASNSANVQQVVAR